MKALSDLTEREILALAIANEEEDSRIYQSFADRLRPDFEGSAGIFDDMAEEERGHRSSLYNLYRTRFGEHLPPIRREDVRGFLKRRPVWWSPNLDLDKMRAEAELMERQAANFYDKAASQATDVSARQLFTELAEVERGHEKRAEEITEAHLTADTKATEERAARRLFVLQYVQPGLAGLIDGSVSTLAPLFAAAFATHSNWQTFLVGLAASVGAGISMGFTEALSDNGEITGRGSHSRRLAERLLRRDRHRRGRGRGRARLDLVDPNPLHGDAVLERHHAGHPRRRARAARRHLHRQRLTARDGGRELAPRRGVA